MNGGVAAKIGGKRERRKGVRENGGRSHGGDWRRCREGGGTRNNGGRSHGAGDGFQGRDWRRE
ncbi:hypothetical protein TIFTF001_055922 [Ficus carica]|uniref:Uncharacterized protein n=1 Tax=Ficus carica TaxID=3494 RepID=A0AA88JGF0_FICCA|nr:hypothetical protein TIFTF001_055922 [Ficus carica]